MTMDGSGAVGMELENYMRQTTCHYSIRLESQISARQVTVRKELLAPRRGEFRSDDLELKWPRSIDIG